METRFEVKTNMDVKHWVEYYRYIWRKRLWTVAILMTIGFIALILKYFLEDFSGGWYFLWFSVYAAWIYFRPWTAARKAMKLDRKFESTEEHNSVTRFSDALYDESKHETSMIPYDKIESICIGKVAIILVDVRKAAIIMDKNGFAEGNLEGFLTFIQEKCPQAKIRK